MALGVTEAETLLTTLRNGTAGQTEFKNELMAAMATLSAALSADRRLMEAYVQANQASFDSFVAAQNAPTQP